MQRFTHDSAARNQARARAFCVALKPRPTAAANGQRLTTND
ncbi:MAG TPA: hypothetical protein VLT85_13340 [Terriglobales bacterium]|nr:hypothetical protein [Terriglobales bacterium]